MILDLLTTEVTSKTFLGFFGDPEIKLHLLTPEALWEPFNIYTVSIAFSGSLK